MALPVYLNPVGLRRPTGSYPPRMPTDDIPPDLLTAQRDFDAAHAAVVAASPRPGRVADWPAEERAELERLRRVRRLASVELHRARAGTEFADARQQERLRDAAREGGA